MRKRIAAILAALGLAIGGGLAVATPAQAISVYDCASRSICLYQWTGYGGPAPEGSAGRWQSSIQNIWNHANGCVNLTAPAAYWPNGDHVWDNSASAITNDDSQWDDYDVIFYNWANCAGNGSSGGFLAISLDGTTLLSNLNNYGIAPGITAYHTITSVQIVHLPVPPS
jgi:hypothetical protein